MRRVSWRTADRRAVGCGDRHRRHHRRAQRSRSLVTLHAPSGIHLLPRGPGAFLARFVLAEAAQRSIDAQYYVWQNDRLGKLLLGALVRAADRGVRVRLLIDDIGSMAKDETLLVIDSHQRMPEDRLVRADLLRAGRPPVLHLGARRPRSHPLIVFLDRLVRRAISLIDKPSRNRIRRTFAFIAMVCTSSPYRAARPAGKLGNTLVSFQRASTAYVMVLDWDDEWRNYGFAIGSFAVFEVTTGGQRPLDMSPTASFGDLRVEPGAFLERVRTACVAAAANPRHGIGAE